MDKLVKGITKDGFMRVYALDATETVNQANLYHKLSPVAAAALGRLISAGLMMGASLKEEDGTVTLQIKCDGPLNMLVVVANSHGEVKGYVEKPIVDIPLKENGKLDVGGAIGNGVLGVIKDLKLKEPYVGQVPLQTGEIGDDIAFYFMQSEQVPSVVALGVLVDRDYSIKCAGGFIIQVMPECDEKSLSKLENSIGGLMSVTEMLSKSMTPEEIIKYVMLGFDVDILEEESVRYNCGCSKERMETALVSLGRDTLQEMIDDGKGAELACHFCDNKYSFATENLIELQKRCKR